MDLDDIVEDEGTREDLAYPLDGDKFNANDIDVWEHPSGCWGMHASHDLAAGDAVEGRWAYPWNPLYTWQRFSPSISWPRQRWGAEPWPIWSSGWPWGQTAK